MPTPSRRGSRGSAPGTCCDSPASRAVRPMGSALLLVFLDVVLDHHAGRDRLPIIRRLPSAATGSNPFGRSVYLPACNQSISPAPATGSGALDDRGCPSARG